MTAEAHTSPPSVDVQRTIDEEISEHEATLAEILPKISMLRARILELKARRNNYSPISRLPTEILIEIMLKEIRRTQSQNIVVSSRSRFALAGVCRGWRAIALSTPELWSSFNATSTHPDGCFAMLRRSKSAPLHIRFVHRTDDIRIIKRHEGVAAAIMSQIRRIYIFEIDTTFLSYLTRVLRTNPHASPASLQVLRLTCRTPGFVLHRGVIPHHMPFLRVLVLHATAFDLPFLPSLVHLSIVSPISQHVGGQPISHLLQCLYSTPNLESMSVGSLVPDMPSQPPMLPLLLLPKLSQLGISSQNIDGVKIFDYLHRPASTVFYCCIPPSTAVAPDLTSLQSIFSVLIDGGSVVNASITLFDTLTIEITLDVFWPSVPVLEHFTLSFPYIDHSHMFDSIMSISAALPLEKTPSLTISGFLCELDEVDLKLKWRRLFQPFQGVKSLCFNYCDDETLLEALCERIDAEYLLLPALQEIRFEECTQAEPGPDGYEDHPCWEPACWADMREFLSERRKLGICVDFYWEDTRFTDLVEETSDSESLYEEGSDEESSDSDLLHDEESNKELDEKE